MIPRTIIKQEIYGDIENGVIQKPINKAIEEANRLMNEDNLTCFDASLHITYFCDISKEEALRLLLNYKAKYLNPKTKFNLTKERFLK